ncbi:MAG TPA: hypothetical protein PLO51_01690 [Candidatus Micrarchaeota archaeon]|nr:hypothetical protein [Candidatus Micrarchaeota archaeon]
MKHTKKLPATKKSAAVKSRGKQASGPKAKLESGNFAIKRPRAKKATFKNGLLLSQSHIRQYLIETAGENAINVMKEFSYEMTDEDLARKCKTKLSDVRAVLNKLHTTGLVEYTRDKDPQSGWYSYIWKINDKSAGGLLEDMSGKTGEKAVDASENTTEQYICNDCGRDTLCSFEAAFENKFKCPSCGNNMSFFDEKEDLPVNGPVSPIKRPGQR